MNYQSTKKGKCDFPFFYIFNDLLVIENGSTSLCCGNSELIRVSLTMTACTRQQYYEGLKAGHMAGCLEYPESEYADCIDETENSFVEYKQQRSVNRLSKTSP